MQESAYHPVFLDLRGRQVVIVGGGEIAAEKVRSLMYSGAWITVVAPEAVEEIVLWHNEGILTWIQREFQAEDLDQAFLSIGATDLTDVNRRVVEIAESKCRLGNSVDDPTHCNFIMAAIARKGAMQIAISSSGCSPALAQRVRDRILDEVLTDEVGTLASVLGQWRPEVQRRLPTYRLRKQFWEHVIDSDVPRILVGEGIEAANEAVESRLCAFAKGCRSHDEITWGKVYLVGAGPGDARLLTLRAVEALRVADVVLYDRLVHPSLLNHVSFRAECTYVGKTKGTPGQSRQDSINALLIQHAKAGKTVVRLKGGDPYVFGRGGEEALALSRAGVCYEVVPGVSSAVAAPALAGIPVTHRGLSSGYAVFTGRLEDDEGDIAWEAAAAIPTAVFLMGLDRIRSIAARLIEHGRSPDTPAAVVFNGSLPEQTVVTGTLETIGQQVSEQSGPATIVIGKVVRLRRELESIVRSAAVEGAVGDLAYSL